MNKIILAIIIAAVAVSFYFFTKPGNDNYNDYMCAQYGKDIRCENKISSEERLRRLKLYQSGEMIRDHIS